MNEPPRPVPGAVLVLAEADYCYGLGTVTLRVTEVGADPRSFPALEWVRVVGHEIRPDGSESPTPRAVLARVAAIREAVRPAGWRPERHGDARDSR